MLDNNELKNIAVITGASSGIGREFVIQLLTRDDIDEFWIIARDLDKLLELKENISKPTKVLALDLSKMDELEKYRVELEKSNVNIKLLINCAGFGKFDHDENIKFDTKLNMIDLNVKAIVSMCDFSLQYMSEGAGIINISSTAGFQPVPGGNIYAATKSFVLYYSRALNAELRYRKIRVLAVCPFWTRTNFFDRAVPSGKKEVVINYAVMYEPENVVKKALKDLKRKKKDVSLYGFKNCCQILLVKLLPHKLVMKVWMLQQKLDGTPNIRKEKSVH